MFKENYEAQMTEVRQSARTRLKEAAQAFNKGEISPKEFSSFKDKVIMAGNDERKKIIAKREKDIDRAEEKIITKVVGPDGDLSRYRELYSQYQKASREDLLKEYKTSIKLNDQAGMKAAAAISIEKNFREISADYGTRNSKFTEAVNEYRGFSAKWRDELRKFSEYQNGHFAFVREPSKKVETYEAGHFRNAQGYMQPYFRDRIIYDE